MTENERDLPSRKLIYVVTSGEYSDYHIVAIYDDLELAKQQHDLSPTKYGGYDTRIEVFELNPTELTSPHPSWAFEWSPGGGLKCWSKRDYSQKYTTYSQYHDGTPQISFTVFAVDEEQAHKAANEKLRAFLAGSTIAYRQEERDGVEGIVGYMMIEGKITEVSWNDLKY